MTENRIKIYSLVENQLPDFVKTEFPLIGEFLQEYYRSTESQGLSSDLLKNIDKYIKLDFLSSITNNTVLNSDLSLFDDEISVQSTIGFPDSYGLLQINNEIILYKEKTNTSFKNCFRGFSGLKKDEIKEDLIFSDSEVSSHLNGDQVTNLSGVLLKLFFNKIKTQIASGFENQDFYSDLNENIFLKNSIDFYASKGSDEAFKILFRALYGDEIKIIKPKDFIFEASTSKYRITKDIIIEIIDGNPFDLKNKTVFQDEDIENDINFASGSVSDVQILDQGEQNYFVIKLDYDYDKDIQVSRGSIVGEFSAHSKTLTLESTAINSKTINVESTIGFPSSGTLIYKNNLGEDIIINYTSKVYNQFLGCEGIVEEIPEKTSLNINSFAYAYDNTLADKIKFRVASIASSVKIPEYNTNYRPRDLIQIETLGKNLSNIIDKNLIYNIPLNYNIEQIEIESNRYKIKTIDENSINQNDEITLVFKNNLEKTYKVLSIEGRYTFFINFDISVSSFIQEDLLYVKKNIQKFKCINFNVEDSLLVNIQNTFFDSNDSLYITSSSLPSYDFIEIESPVVKFSGRYDGTIGTDLLYLPKNKLVTGDYVEYIPGEGENNKLNIEETFYYVKKVGEDYIQLSRSKPNLLLQKYVTISSKNSSYINSDGNLISGEIFENKLVLKKYSSTQINSQKLVRKISKPINDQRIYKTLEGSNIGILNNGVEISNYKSGDAIFSGPIDEIVVKSGGSGYDVINPPLLSIQDNSGSSATALCEVEGYLERIDIIDPGLDFYIKPSIKIVGGNGKDASAEINLATIENILSFNSSDSTLINIQNNTIGFGTYHRFINGEQVIYDTQKQTSIGGLSTSRSYFVSIVDDFKVKLYEKYSDSIVGINTIDLVSYGSGIHKIKSYTNKNRIGSISVKNPGSGYRNKKIVVPYTNINAENDSIYVKNHGYKTGEIIIYNSLYQIADGLIANKKYYINVIDNDNFRLCEIGTGNISETFYLETNQYVDIRSQGNYEHTFTYEPISIEISGISSTSRPPVLQPIFRGSIKNIFISNPGYDYGDSEIINYNKQPTFILNTGSNAELEPIILEGKIEYVLVKNSGRNYNSIPDIKIIGDGKGAKLTPIIVNGQIKSVVVNTSGIGYSKNKTYITVSPTGSGASFESKIQKWTINEVEKLIYFNSIYKDDGYIKNGYDSIQYTHLYAPRELRKVSYASKYVGGKLNYSPDLRFDNNGEEILSDRHSPILGWAYDGNPIYGPYGFSNVDGTGGIKCMNSSYEQITNYSSNRPFQYPAGYFIEDYVYTGNGDLDEHNGRFCVTPEYPNGTYAYFMTINSGSVESDPKSLFKKYRKPVFPYVIGNTFKSKPIDFNFDKNSRQDIFDPEKSNLIRNTYYYNFNKKNTNYEYVKNPLSPEYDTKKQFGEIDSASIGQITDFNIVGPGNNYQVGDKILISESYKDDSEISESFTISKVKGKEVESIEYTSLFVDNIELYPQTKNYFIGIATLPHNLNNGDYINISGLTTSILSQTNNNSTYQIEVSPKIYVLQSKIENSFITGDITYIKVFGDLKFPEILVDDILKIDDEKVKVLSVDREKSILKIEREIDNTIGYAHSISTIISEIPRKIKVNLGVNYFDPTIINRKYYFDPQNSVSIGLTEGIGIGNTFDLPNVSIGKTQVFVPTKSIYLENHSLETGDKLIYSSNGNDPIKISLNGSTSFDLQEKQELFVVKITEDLIGISTVKLYVGSGGTYISSNGNSTNTVYFGYLGTGDNHIFETDYPNVLNVGATRNIVTVSTASTHGLNVSDRVDIEVLSGVSTEYKVSYNDKNRRLIINPTIFSSSDVDLQNNTITILNHDFKTGDKVICKTEDPFTGFNNDSIYFSVYINKDTIKLSKNYYQATLSNPITINFDNASGGYIAKVNPQIEIYKNSKIVFNLSDSSLSSDYFGSIISAFDFKLFFDMKYTNEFLTLENESKFLVKKTGIIGISSDAKVEVEINNNVPSEIYYSLIPINANILPDSKSKYFKDGQDINNNNKITIKNSLYNGSYTITENTSTTYSFPISYIPERLEYLSPVSDIKYTTSSKTAYGSINSILLNTFKRKYQEVPVVNAIETKTGFGAFLIPNTSNIGELQSIKIKNISFEYPSDITLRPTCIFPQILRIQPLFFIESIQIQNEGVGYKGIQDLIVVDNYDKKISEKIKLQYDADNKKIIIISNEPDLLGSNPIIFPYNNINGVGISSATYNQELKLVTLQLDTFYSSLQQFPFASGDKILVENIINDGSNGFNSSDYEYNLFTIEDIDPNIGGYLPTITYSLESFLDDLDTVGEFLPQLSFGRVVNEKDLPKFIVNTGYNNFNIGEDLKSINGNTLGSVLEWNTINRTLKISSNSEIKSSQTVFGSSSNSIGVILSNDYQKTEFEIGASSIVNNNWIDETGFLNNIGQKIHDNEFYQYFSYALNSNISYNEWKTPVKSLVHPSGFKEFSELNINSQPNIITGDCNLTSGICTDQNNGSFEVISDLTSEIDLDCYPDFDITKEITYNISDNLVSNEIIFNSRILSDYFESIGNRVLEIQTPDDTRGSTGGITQASLLDEFAISSKKYKKYITFAQFSEDENLKQISLVSAAHNGQESFINEYAIVSTSDKRLGYYDIDLDYGIATLKFIPEDRINYSQRDYINTVISFDINSNIVGINTFNFGNIVSVEGSYSLSQSGFSTSKTIAIIPKNEYRSSKILVGITSESNQFFQLNELTIIHDDSNVSLLDYGKIIISDQYPNGIGTYVAYIENDDILVDFIADSAINFNCDYNASIIKISNFNSVGSGSTTLNTGKVESVYTQIPIDPLFESVTIAKYVNDDQFGAYLIVSLENSSTNDHQVSELVVLTDTINQNASIVEYGSIFTNDRLGYFTTEVIGNETYIKFTPNVLVNLESRLLITSVGLPESDSNTEEIKLGNISISGSNSSISGFTITLNRSFELYNDGEPIFRRTFDGSDKNIVSIASSSIYLYDHNFVTGEKVNYYHELQNKPIGIVTTNISGIGSTDILPSDLYVVRVNKSTIKLSATAEDALKPVPNVLRFSSVGIGNSHTIMATKQNEKSLITIDNWIQSPISRTEYKLNLVNQVELQQNIIKVSGISSIFSGDLVKIDNEYLLVDDVGIGTDKTLIRVRRDWMNTGIQTHAIGSEVRKYTGNYNIHKNIITFVGDPLKDTPQETTHPDEIDYTGIQTSSSFYGRIFLRSGVVGSSNTAYRENYVFDDISSQFKTLNGNFLLTSDGNYVEDVADLNSVILIKDVFQLPNRSGTPDIEGSYYIGGSGISTVFFTGTKNNQVYDINSFSVPIGGVIQSVSSISGSGYQPLVSAGGTAVINIAGVLQSISIGSSGSGYRENIQPVVNVGIITGTNLETPQIITIGYASISNGQVYDITVTVPQSNLDPNNPPEVVIDDPIPYNNIPLIYSSSSPVNGIGTQATADIVVGQNGDIIDFEIKNYGYSYDNFEILTLPINDGYGLPTNSSISFSEFQLKIEKSYSDKFSGWSMGEFVPLDKIENLFNGQRNTFQLSIDSNPYPIVTRKGSNIDIKLTLLVFINNILQRPDVGYKFDGGSFITFAEPPKKGDRCEIIFYKGTPGVDVLFKDIIETIESGDDVRVDSDNNTLKEDERLVTKIKTIDSINTNPYSGPGIIDNLSLERPIVWCKQRNDIVLSNGYYTKDRIIYEPSIHPSCNLISGVGIGSTHIFVDNLIPFFGNEKENISNERRNSIEIISQKDVSTKEAKATAILNSNGILTGFLITDKGYGYSYPPEVFIEDNVGIALSLRPIVQSSIIDGIVTDIQIVSQSNISYTSIPNVIISPPQTKYEMINDVEYEGDFGNIVGIATTTTPQSPNGLIFQLEIPRDSILRDASITGFAVTTSRLQKDYYFKVSNSNVGNGIVSLDSQGNIVCQGNNYIDNVFKVIDTYFLDNIINLDTTETSLVEYASPTAIENFNTLTIEVNSEVTIGDYDNLDVLVSVNSYGTLVDDVISSTNNNFYGTYSWGKITATKRISEIDFELDFPKTIVGITTSTPVVRRTNPLSYSFYDK
jgi:hypothetical protein